VLRRYPSVCCCDRQCSDRQLTSVLPVKVGRLTDSFADSKWKIVDRIVFVTTILFLLIVVVIIIFINVINS
jgi:hypothetical protein